MPPWAGTLGRAALFALLVLSGLLAFYARDLPSTEAIYVFDRSPSVTFVDRHGRTIATRGLSKGHMIALAALPSHVPDAVLAVEDRRFWYHPGIDPVGMSRAAIANLKAGRIVQGGSTITQQLAKNLFLTPERTFKRKIQEMMLAVWLEVKFTKRQILEIYLNRVYMGAGTYGVESAAQRYFGKSASDLSLPEAAMIAGLLKAPSRYAPTNDLNRAKARAAVVLAAMADTKTITAEEARLATISTPRVVDPAATPGVNYYVDWAMDRVTGYIGAYTENLVIETTLDLTFQKAAEAALSYTLDRAGEPMNVSQGGIVAMDLSGGMIAMVGGRSYHQSQFNRVTQAMRQPGSAFKPFVYLTALERGWRPSDRIEDKPISIGNWSPGNYKDEYLGDMSLTTALAKSINTVAVQLGESVGRGNIVKAASRIGIRCDLKPIRSLSLGTTEMTLLDLTTGYVPFANGGHGVFPHTIARISTRAGEVLYQRQGIGPGRVVDENVIGSMNMMLSETVRMGTGRKARLDDGRPMAGKTGTSQDFRDAWFIGYTANIVAGVWVGNDDNTPMRKVTGGTLPALIWKDFVTRSGTNGTLWALPAGQDMDRDFAARQPAEDEKNGLGSLLDDIGRFLSGN